MKAPTIYVIHIPSNSVMPYSDTSIYRIERYISRMAKDCREHVSAYEIAIGEGDLAYKMMTNDAGK